MTFREYESPEGVGWKGYINNGNGDVVAFVRLNGEIVTRWGGN